MGKATLLHRALYLLGKRRAEAKARRDLEDLAQRFEMVNEGVCDELRALRQRSRSCMRWRLSRPSPTRRYGFTEAGGGDTLASSVYEIQRVA
jgi:hypothetical protein